MRSGLPLFTFVASQTTACKENLRIMRAQQENSAVRCRAPLADDWAAELEEDARR